MTFEDAQKLLDNMLPRFGEYKRNTDADGELTASEKDVLLNIVIDFKNDSGQYDYRSALDSIKDILDSRFRVSPNSKITKENGGIIYSNPPAVPFLVKQVIFFIAVSCIENEDIEYTQTDICKHLNLSHNFFGKLGRTPKEYVDMQIHTQPDRIINYNGHKDEELGIAIKNLVYQAGIHDYFVDIFGGTGAASTAVNHRDNVQYVYNDKDKLMYNLFKVIADNELYIELIEAIKLLQEDLRGDGEWLTNVNFDAEIGRFCSNPDENEKLIRYEYPNEIKYNDEDIVKYMQQIYDCLNLRNKDYIFTLEDGTNITVADLTSKIFFNTKTNEEDAKRSFKCNYKIIRDIGDKYSIYLNGYTQDINGNVIAECSFTKEKKLQQYRFYKYFAYFDNLVTSYDKVSIQSIQKDRVLYAVAVVFRYCSVVRGEPNVLSILRMRNDSHSRDNKIGNPTGFLEKDYQSLITAIHNSVKGTRCENEDYLEVINRYKSHGKQNAKSPLFYSDSPYVATKGYRIPFADTEIVKLIKALIDSGDKFIFSCRAVKSSDDETDKDKNKIDEANDKIFRYVFGSFLAAPEIYVDVIDDKQDYKKFKEYKEKILNGEEPDINEDKKKEYYKKLYVLSIGNKKELEDAIKTNKIAEIMITNFEIASFEANIKKKKGKTVKEQEVKFQAYTFEEFLEVLCRNANNQLTDLLKQKFHL